MANGHPKGPQPKMQVHQAPQPPMLSKEIKHFMFQFDVLPGDDGTRTLLIFENGEAHLFVLDKDAAKVMSNKLSSPNIQVPKPGEMFPAA